MAAHNSSGGGGTGGGGDDGGRSGGADELPTAELTRPSPDAILADEADPDTLLGIESDSDAGSSRPVSMVAANMRASKRVSRQLLDVPLGGPTKDDKDHTPTQGSFAASQVQTAVKPAESEEELREQVNELTIQVTGLNNKLVTSFMRIGDLEDDASEMQETVAAYRRQIATLEKEREEHLAALNTGLLVEKEHVSTEMQKMMERLVQETAEKGKAVSDKQKIESELDELSSSLFSEANKMVAVERLARARAEEKSKSMEERLKDTEEIVGQQQKRLVELQSLVERSEQPKDANQDQLATSMDNQSTGLMRKPSRNQQHSLAMAENSGLLRLDIVPYVELRAFLNHLRRLRLQLAPFYTYPVTGNMQSEDSLQGTPVVSRTGSPSPFGHAGGSSFNQNTANNASPFLAAGVTRHKDFPTLPANVEQLTYLPTQLSSISFLKRMNEEDCEPCVRLDVAPGLNWLSRRQMQTAILEGSLMIEPIFGGGIYDEEQVRTKALGAPPAACAMCGKAVVNVPLPGGGTASDASGWMNAASSLQASVNAMASSLPGRELTASPPPGAVTGAGGGREVTKSKSSIFSTLRNISGGSSRTPSANATDSIAQQQSQVQLQSVGVTEDLFAKRPPPIPTHIFRISESSTARYLLCPDFCLRRLRATCDFWGYIRNLERAVVLEGKFAWDDEAVTQDDGDGVPRVPSKDEKLSKDGLQDEDGLPSKQEGTEAGGKPGTDDVTEEQKTENAEEKKQGSEESAETIEGETAQANVRNRKTTSIAAGSDVEDDHDFADAKSQTSDDDGEGDKAKEDEQTPEGSTEGEVADAAGEEAVGAENKEETSEVESKGDPTTPTISSAEEPTASAATPVPPPLPKSARPTPKIAGSLTSAPPALPPRRARTPATPLSPGAVSLGPEPRRLLPVKGAEKPSWEEKVWLEVNQLRADLWSARVGIQPDDN